MPDMPYPKDFRGSALLGKTDMHEHGKMSILPS